VTIVAQCLQFVLRGRVVVLAVRREHRDAIVEMVEALRRVFAQAPPVHEALIQLPVRSQLGDMLVDLLAALLNRPLEFLMRLWQRAFARRLRADGE